MAKDFIPSADNKLLGWLAAFKSSGSNLGAGLGLSPAEITQLQTLCTEYMDQIALVDRVLKQAKSEVTKKKSMRKTHVGKLRKLIKKMKASPNYNQPNGANMGILPHKQETDWGTYQPVIKVRAIEELVEIKFRKYGMNRMEFRGRPENGDWQYLGERSHSPFYFKPKDQAPGTITKWEFTGRAIVKDEPVGVPSGAVSVVYVAK